LWFVIGTVIVAILIAIVAAWQRGDEYSDFGSVSHQWIAEHRLGQTDDPRR
jgi:hypothetical protein